MNNRSLIGRLGENKKLLAKIFRDLKPRPRRLPREFRDRAADFQGWTDRFGDDFPLADKVMKIFCEAFLFDPAERHQFRPGDKLGSIYRAVYPFPWMPDGLEYVHLIQNLESEFGFKFDETRLETIDTFEQLLAEIQKMIPSKTSGTSGEW